MTPLETLRSHVTGAIERGESVAVEGIPARVRIVTNNVPRPLLDWSNLTAKEAAEFYYLVPDPALDGAALAQLCVERGITPEQYEREYFAQDRRYPRDFVKFKGHVYDLGDFQRVEERHAGQPFAGWTGYQSDSYFSAVLVRYPPVGDDTVVMGTYYS